MFALKEVFDDSLLITSIVKIIDMRWLRRLSKIKRLYNCFRALPDVKYRICPELLFNIYLYLATQDLSTL